MNAPENINTINAAHGILLRSEVALSVEGEGRAER